MREFKLLAATVAMVAAFRLVLWQWAIHRLDKARYLAFGGLLTAIACGLSCLGHGGPPCMAVGWFAILVLLEDKNRS